MLKVAVHAEKYAICTLLGNMRIMPRSHKIGTPTLRIPGIVVYANICRPNKHTLWGESWPRVCPPQVDNIDIDTVGRIFTDLEPVLIRELSNGTVLLYIQSFLTQLSVIMPTVKHTQMSSSYSSLGWVLSHWAHFTVPRFFCVYVCVYPVILHMCCIIVTQWGGPGGTEA